MKSWESDGLCARVFFFFSFFNKYCVSVCVHERERRKGKKREEKKKNPQGSGTLPLVRVTIKSHGAECGLGEGGSGTNNPIYYTCHYFSHLH